MCCLISSSWGERAVVAMVPPWMGPGSGRARDRLNCMRERGADLAWVDDRPRASVRRGGAELVSQPGVEAAAAVVAVVRRGGGPARGCEHRDEGLGQEL